MVVAQMQPREGVTLTVLPGGGGMRFQTLRDVWTV
jgi:hypothetical protein